MDMFSPEYRQLYQRLMGIYEHSLKEGVEINFLMKSTCRLTILCGDYSSHVLFDYSLSSVFDDNPFPERLVIFDPDNTDWDELALRYMRIKSNRTKTNRAVENRD